MKIAGSHIHITSEKKYVLEKLHSLSSSLYYIKISVYEIHHLVGQKSTNPSDFMIWHNRLGHPDSIMMRQIIKNSNGHSLKVKKC